MDVKIIGAGKSHGSVPLIPEFPPRSAYRAGGPQASCWRERTPAKEHAQPLHSPNWDPGFSLFFTEDFYDTTIKSGLHFFYFCNVSPWFWIFKTKFLYTGTVPTDGLIYLIIIECMHKWIYLPIFFVCLNFCLLIFSSCKVSNYFTFKIFYDNPALTCLQGDEFLAAA